MPVVCYVTPACLHLDGGCCELNKKCTPARAFSTLQRTTPPSEVDELWHGVYGEAGDGDARASRKRKQSAALGGGSVEDQGQGDVLGVFN